MAPSIFLEQLNKLKIRAPTTGADKSEEISDSLSLIFLEVFMSSKILRLNKAGTPVSWLTREETATLLVKNLVIWSMGNTVMEIRGGVNRQGEQSFLR